MLDIAFSDEVIAVGVEEKISATVDDFQLAQNYPNPFNPTTHITYNINKADQVTLTVYNLQGQVVAKLVDEKQSAGQYDVKFNASELSSGVYVYKLETGAQSLSQKMMLIK